MYLKKKVVKKSHPYLLIHNHRIASLIFPLFACQRIWLCSLKPTEVLYSTFVIDYMIFYLVNICPIYFNSICI